MNDTTTTKTAADLAEGDEVNYRIATSTFQWMTVTSAPRPIGGRDGSVSFGLACWPGQRVRAFATPDQTFETR